MSPLIIFIEDDQSIASFVEATLQQHGYQVMIESTGKGGLQKILQHLPDCVLLDLGLPDIEGFEVLEQLRTWSDMPVIVLSARDQEKMKVKALDLGADDYMTKPFGLEELLARIRAALRHKKSNQSRYEIGRFVLDDDKHEVSIDQKPIHLTPIEFKILRLLVQNVGKVVTLDQIARAIWGPYIDDLQVVRVNVANIRRKIEHNPAVPEFIQTEVGVGYRFIEKV